MNNFSFAGILAAALLVLGNAFFVAVEFALVRAHPTKVKHPDEAKKFGTKSSIALLDDLDNGLSATQLGITICSLLLGWIGELTFAGLFEQLADVMGLQFSPIVIHTTATALAFSIVTFFHVVIGELVAKSLAIRYPEPVLRYCAPGLLIFSKVCRPFIFIFIASANLVLSMFGMRTVPESERVHSADELSMLISASSEHGVLDKSEEEMLKGIFGFSETVAREIMTPRLDLVTIPISSTLDEVIHAVTGSGFSRFPVTGDNIDHVVGIILARDLLSIIEEKKQSSSKDFDLKKHLREAYFIPGTKPIDDLLNEFKRRKAHMAIVLDEHGGVDGAVTLEDILEEIVGDIFDESDRPESDVVIEEDGDILLDGGLLVADVNQRFNVSIPEGDYDTIGGFIFSALGRMSQQGDQVHIRNSSILAVNGVPIEEEPVRDGEIDRSTPEDIKEQPMPKKMQEALLTVERLAGNRIETVRVHIVSPLNGDGHLPPPVASDAVAAIKANGGPI